MIKKVNLTKSGQVLDILWKHMKKIDKQDYLTGDFRNETMILVNSSEYMEIIENFIMETFGTDLDYFGIEIGFSDEYKLCPECGINIFEYSDIGEYEEHNDNYICKQCFIDNMSDDDVIEYLKEKTNTIKTANRLISHAKLTELGYTKKDNVDVGLSGDDVEAVLKELQKDYKEVLFTYKYTCQAVANFDVYVR